jgi:hypothetical protein
MHLHGWLFLGYLGSVNEANDLIRRISCEPCASAWMALLGACKIHGYVELGEEIVKGASASNLCKCLQAISYQSHIILLVCGISMHISTTGMVCMKNQSHLD